MKVLVVLALVAVVVVESMPQAAGGVAETPSSAVQQTPQSMVLTTVPGSFPTQLVQIASPLFQGAAATAGAGQGGPQLFSLTPVMIHQLSEAEQNALAHREFLKIWEAQAIRNQAIPAGPAAPAAAPAPAPAAPVPVEAPAAPASAPAPFSHDLLFTFSPDATPAATSAPNAL